MPNQPPPRLVPCPRKFRPAFVIVPALVGVFGACVIGITGYFRLSPETTALGQIMREAAPGKWNTKIAVHVGWFTTALVRAGSHCFELEPEPRAALDTLRSAEVGVYELEQPEAEADRAAVLARADKAMARRGWDRLVGVCHSRDLVAVYIPHRGLKPTRVKCCVLVFSDRNLVVASAKINAEPLLALATKNGPLLPPDFAHHLQAHAAVFH